MCPACTRQYDAARDAFQQVIRTSPGHARVLQQLGWLRNSLSGSDAAAADAPASSPHPSAGVGAGASADAPVEDPGSWVFGQQAPARSQRPPVCSQQLAISCLRRSVQASEQSEITRPPCVQRAENHCVRYRCALHPPVVTPPPYVQTRRTIVHGTCWGDATCRSSSTWKRTRPTSVP